jgi:hypothetical protein
MKTFFKAIATEKGFEGEIISDSRSYMSPRYNVETRTFSKPEPMTREQFVEHVRNTDWKSFKVEEYSIN